MIARQTSLRNLEMPQKFHDIHEITEEPETLSPQNHLGNDASMDSGLRMSQVSNKQ